MLLIDGGKTLHAVAWNGLSDAAAVKRDLVAALMSTQEWVSSFAARTLMQALPTDEHLRALLTSALDAADAHARSRATRVLLHFRPDRDTPASR